MSKKATFIKGDLIDRDEDFVHRGGMRSGWDEINRSATRYVLGDKNPRNEEEALRMINSLCANRCSVLAEGKRTMFSINPTEATACTNGTFIRVGTAVLDTTKTFDEKADIMVGLTTHEMAHVRHSTFKDMAKNPLQRSIENIIEDERIEHILTEEFPGYANALASTKEYMLDEKYLIEKAIEDKRVDTESINMKLDPKKKKAMEIFDIFFKLVRYPVHIDEAKYKEHEEQINKIKEILTPYPMTSEEMQKASKEVYDVINKEMKDALSPKKKKQKPQKSEEDGEEGDGEGSGKSSKSNKKGKPGKGKKVKAEEEEEEEEQDDSKDSKDPGKDSEEEEKEEKEGKSGGKEEEEEADSEEEDDGEGKDGEDAEEEEEEPKEKSEEEKAAEAKAKAEDEKAEEELANAIDDIEKAISSLMEQFESDNDPNKTNIEDSLAASKINYNEEYIHDPESDATFRTGKPNKSRYDHLAGGIAADARRLAGALFTKVFSESKNLRGTRSGNLDDAKIIEAAHSIQTVYTQRIEKETRKLNVVVLIDESGSMGCQGGDKVDSAAKAGILFEKTFDIFHAGELFVYGFTSDYQGDHNRIIRYREPGLKVKHGLGDVKGRANNRDGDCIRAVARRVRSFTQDPMLFFIISDGQPNAHDYSGYSDTRHAVTHVTKMRFFPVQIGIGRDIEPAQQARMFDEFIHYDTPKQMVDDLRKLILRKAHKIFGL